MHRFRVVLIPLSLLLLSLSAKAQSKINAELQSKIFSAAGDTSLKIWLFLEDSAFNAMPFPMSEKSLTRRHKADPANYLVDTRDFTINPTVLESFHQRGIRVRRVSRWLKALSVEITVEQIPSIMEMPIVKRLEQVRTLVTSPPVEVQEAPTDELKSGSGPKAAAFDYGPSKGQIDFINATRLQQAGFTGRGVTIAIFDTGFDLAHPAFDSLNPLATYDFINDVTDVDNPDCPGSFSNSQTYHGTLTLGVIAGNDPGELIGVAPHADIVLAKTEISCGGTEIKVEEDNWIAAAEWADSIGVDIINSSLGYTAFQDGGSYSFADLDGNTALITIAADVAASKNILVVNSAGNERLNSWGHIVTPADGDSVLAVGAVAGNGELAPFSSPGPTADGRIKPDISTLGIGVFSSSISGGYAYVSGTSFSSPLVAGGAALAFHHDSTLTAKELTDLIKANGSLADSPDNDFGYGLYDAAASADIIRILNPEQIQEDIHEQFQAEILTAGRSQVIPTISGIDLPAWITLTDNLDGTGRLEVTTPPEQIDSYQFGVIADVGYYADTVYIGFSTKPFLLGPNPFSNRLTIIINPSAGRFRSVTIFSVFGDFIWEFVKEPAQSTDRIEIEWDGRNLSEVDVAAGVYIVLIKTDRQEAHIKVLKTG